MAQKSFPSHITRRVLIAILTTFALLSSSFFPVAVRRGSTFNRRCFALLE